MSGNISVDKRSGKLQHSYLQHSSSSMRDSTSEQDDLNAADTLRANDTLRGDESPENGGILKAPRVSTGSRVSTGPTPDDLQELDMIGDDYENEIIDKTEMMETSDDQDLLSSPSSRLSMSLNGDEEKEIDGFTNFNMILEYPRLHFEAEETGSFNEEVMDWFSANDLKALQAVKTLGESEAAVRDPARFLRNLGNSLSQLVVQKNEPKILRQIIRLTYFVLGGFGRANSEDQIVRQMMDHSALVAAEPKLVALVANLVNTRANSLADAGNCEAFMTAKRLQLWSNQLFYAMTVLHVVILSILKGLDVDSSARKTLISTLYANDLLGGVTRAIDKWRWISCESEENEASSIINSLANADGEGSPSRGAAGAAANGQSEEKSSSTMSLSIVMAFKLRNVILLLNDLILLQFGGAEQLKAVKDYLSFKHSDRGVAASTKISPVDYRNYRQDLTTRYPTFTPPQYELSHILDVSLQNDEEMPETQLPSLTRSVSILSSQGSLKPDSAVDPMADLSNPPNIHIATPMPSPSLTPQHTGGSSSSSNISEYHRNAGDSKRKLFLTQPEYPNIYPYADAVPFSIEEAADIFYHNVQDNFYSKQFVSTFEQFVQEDERVAAAAAEPDSAGDFVYTDQDVRKDPMFEPEIAALQRVEKYYHDNLPYFSSLIYVLIQIVSSNVIPVKNDPKRMRPRGGAAAGAGRMQQPSQPQPGESDDLKKPLFVKNLDASDRQKLEVSRMKESTLKCATNIILLLTKWFKRSHVLKYEYFTALLFDNNFILQSFRLLDSNKMHVQWGKTYDFKDADSLVHNRLVYCDYKVLYRLKEYNFFMKALSLSSAKDKVYRPVLSEPQEFHDIFQNKEDGANESILSFILPFNAQCNVSVENPNTRYCLIVSNLFRILYSIVSHFKIQRIYKLLEARPTDTLRFYLTLFNEQLYRPILKIIKLMSPFSGKKWRANNMDMISFVYLFYKVGLKDRWLTNYFTGTLEERLKVSYENEYALRCLLKYYNVSNYADTLRRFGYDVRNKKLLKDNQDSSDGFFDSQVDLLASDEFQDYLKIE